MQTQVETSNPLEHSLELSISQEKVQAEVDNRLKRLAPKVKIQGFRPGKVPLKIVAQQHGLQIHQEVLGEMLQKQFYEAVKKEGFQIAGSPSFEARNSAEHGADYEFSVIFEIYPDFELIDFSVMTVNMPALQIGEAEVQKTVDVLRKQRANYESVDRPAESGDKVSIDYQGKLDGNDFAGGQADNYSVVLGDGHLLPDFETSVLGMSAEQEKSFDMTFPADYPGKEVAGKAVTFTVKLNKVEAPVLPDVDSEFAKLLGVQDGDVSKMQDEIRANLQRETNQRIRAKLKDQIMQTLLDMITFQVPKTLIQQEVSQLMEDMRNAQASRGSRKKELDLPREMFLEKAERRVKLGLILAKLIKAHGLSVKPEQIRHFIEEYAQSYENPEQVVKWHYASPERLKGIEPLILEDNVVSWMLERANVVEQGVTFEELMGHPYANNV
jgi:trigger factor